MRNRYIRHPLQPGEHTIESDALYLELLKRCLLGSIYDVRETLVPLRRRPTSLGRAIVGVVRKTGLELARRAAVPPELYEEGRGQPQLLLAHGETMIGRKRLENVHACVEDVLARRVEGDLIEAGVWRGGVPILMRALLAVRGVSDRRVWVADSFQGLPPASPEYPMDELVSHEGAFAVSLEQVRANFARYGFLDEQVRFVEGWFRDSLPPLAGHRWAVVRVDADRYESTTDALESLYSGLSVGGYLIVDDYGAFEACREAVHDFRSTHGITETIEQIDWTGVFWRRQQ